MQLSFQKKQLLVVIIIWAFIQVLLVYKYGIITSNEAVKYSREANNILQHKNFSEQKYIFYSAYILIHVLFIKLGFETVGVYIVQLLLNLTATILFYKTSLTVYKNSTIAFLSALLLTVCISWQYWTVCLYTESIFCSLVIIFMYCLFGINKNSRAKYLYAALIFILLVFARPTGVLFIPVIALLFFYRLLKAKRNIAAFVSAVILLLCFTCLVYYEMHSAASFNFIKPFVEHNVICDIPNSSPDKNNYGTGVSPVIKYVSTNPGEFAHLCFLRCLSFWGLTRTYYSTSHNWILRLFFYPLYFFAVISIIKQFKKNSSVILFCLSTLIIFTISVMLTCDEWSSRFIMPVIPIVLFLASYGIAVFKKQDHLTNH